jgi:hypothetical protein
MSTNTSAEELVVRRCGQAAKYSNVCKIQFTAEVYAAGGQLFFTWAILKQPQEKNVVFPETLQIYKFIVFIYPATQQSNNSVPHLCQMSLFNLRYS